MVRTWGGAMMVCLSLSGGLMAEAEGLPWTLSLPGEPGRAADSEKLGEARKAFLEGGYAKAFGLYESAVPEGGVVRESALEGMLRSALLAGAERPKAKSAAVEAWIEGNALLHDGKEGAVALFEQAVKADSSLVQAYRDLAHQLNAAGDEEKRDAVVVKAMGCGEFDTQMHRMIEEWSPMSDAEEGALYKKLLDQRPSDVRLQYLTSRLLGEGLPTYRAIVEADPGFYWGHHGLAFAVDEGEKLSAWGAAREQCPEGRLYRLHLAKALLADGREADAWKVLEECRAAYRELVALDDYHVRRGSCLRAEGKLEEAAASFFQALEMGRTYWFSSELSLMVDYYPEDPRPASQLAGLWSSNDRYDKALVYADLARRIDPGFPDAWRQRARIAWNWYEPLENVAFFGTNSSLKEGDLWLRRYELYLQLLSGEWKAAKELGAEIAGSFNSFSVYRFVGTTLKAAELPPEVDDEAAIKVLAEGVAAAVSLSTFEPRLLPYAAKIVSRVRECPQQVIADAVEGLEHFGDGSAVAEALVVYLAKLPDGREAALDAALDELPLKNQETLLVLLLSAGLLGQDGAQVVVDHEATDAQRMNSLAWKMAQNEVAPKVAVVLSSAAVESSDVQRHMWDTHALCLHRNGKSEEAIGYQERYRSSGRWDVGAEFRMGDYLAAAGQAKEAFEVWDRIAERDPIYAEIVRFRKVLAGE